MLIVLKKRYDKEALIFRNARYSVRYPYFFIESFDHKNRGLAIRLQYIVDRVEGLYYIKEDHDDMYRDLLPVVEWNLERGERSLPRPLDDNF